MDTRSFPEITIRSSGQKMVAKLYRPDAPPSERDFPAVLILHGYRSRRQRYGALARKIIEHGHVALTYSARGHGDSEGDITKLTLEDHYADALAAFDYLAAQPNVNSHRLAVFGSSLGAYLGTILTGDRSVKVLSLSAPAIYPDENWDEPIGNHAADKLRQFRETADFSKLRPMQALASFTGTLLVAPHELDEMMPLRIAETYFESATIARHRIIKQLLNAKHSLDPQSAAHRDKMVVNWLKTYP